MSSLYKLSLYFLAAVTLVVAACEKSPSVQGGSSDNGDSWAPYYDLTGLTVDGKFPIVAWTGITAEESEYKMEIMRDRPRGQSTDAAFSLSLFSNALFPDCLSADLH